MEAVEREIDALGRIVIPKAWREDLGKQIVLYRVADEIHVRPKRVKKFSDLPKIEVALKARLTDWHAVAKELRE